MGVFIRNDSPYFWLWLEGHRDERGRTRSEKTTIRRDAPTPQLRKANRQQAEEQYHTRMAELAKDGDRPGRKLAITFAVFAEWFETHVLPKRRGHEREGEILPLLVTFFGPFVLTAIDRAKATEYMTSRDVSARTVNREVDLLKAMMQAAVPKYLTASPLYGMKRLPTKTPKRRLMTDDEERRLLAVMDAENAAFLLVGLDTLTRLSDIIDLKATDDHGDHLWIADPKAGGGFNVPVSKRLREALDKIPEDGREYLFPKRRIAKTERDRRNSVRQMLERYCALADPPIAFGQKAGGLSFHWATRRTGATRMLTRGVDPGTVQKVGRWKGPEVVLGIYHELLDDKARAAVEAVGPPTLHRRKRKNAKKQARKRKP